MSEPLRRSKALQLLLLGNLLLGAAWAGPWLVAALYRARNERTARKVLRAIVEAQAEHVKAKGAPAGLFALNEAGFLHVWYADGREHGYAISAEVDGPRWSATATPLHLENGDRAYFVDQTGALREREPPIRRPGPHDPAITE